MRKIFAIVLLILGLSVGHAEAGPIRVFEFDQIGGVTVEIDTGNSGTSWVATLDQTNALGDGIVGIYNLTYPHAGRGNDGKSGVTYIQFGAASAASATPTGDATTAGVTISYYYIVTDLPKTPKELESLGPSGVTLITTMAVDSAESPFQVHSFSPEFGRYLHVLVGSAVTVYERPGVIIGVQ